MAAPRARPTRRVAGAVYLFSLVRGGFQRAQRLRASLPGVRFGAAVAVCNFDGSRTEKSRRERQIAVGAPHRPFFASADGLGLSLPEAGAVFIYRPASSAIDYVNARARCGRPSRRRAGDVAAIGVGERRPRRRAARRGGDRAGLRAWQGADLLVDVAHRVGSDRGDAAGAGRDRGG